MAHPETERHFNGRFRVAESAIRQVLAAGFGDRHLPADLILSDFYHQHRQCGSGDRAFINRAVYSLLRYWGWLRALIPDEKRQLLETGRISLQSRDIAAMLAFSLGCEQPDTALVNALLDLASLPNGRMSTLSSDPRRRAGQLADGIFGVSRTFDWHDLLPASLPELSPGLDQAAYCERLTRRPPLWLRLCRPELAEAVLAQLAEQGVEGRVFPALPTAMQVVSGTVDLRRLSSFRNGEVEVQDLASQCVGVLAAPRPGERWLDACAGAGGKTLQLAALMSGRGRIDAGDIRPAVLEELRRRARRGNWSNISAKVHDGSHWPSRHLYDGVLIDAPCSGSGVWRRNPGQPWQFSGKNAADFAARQLKILHDFSRHVRPGGVLIYATCSVFAAENEDVVTAFLREHDDFALADAAHPLTGKPIGGLMHAGSGIADCDELFAARMIRK